MSTCFTCPYACYSFLCTLLPRSRLFIQTVFFQKYILAVLFLLQYQSFFSICLFSYYLFIFFSAFISLMLQELKQSQDQKNRYFQNFIDFLKSLSWSLIISAFYSKMVLVNCIQPTLTHIRLPERKIKKLHTSTSFKWLLFLSY